MIPNGFCDAMELIFGVVDDVRFENLANILFVHLPIFNE